MNIKNIEKISKTIVNEEKTVEMTYERATTNKWYGCQKTTIRCGTGAIIRTQLLGEITEQEVIELLGVQ